MSVRISSKKTPDESGPLFFEAFNILIISLPLKLPCKPTIEHMI